MIDIDDIQLYLPKFLTPDQNNSILGGIKDFPKNLDKRMYLDFKDNAVLQGDGVRDLLVVNLPDKEIREAPVMVISNTCDIFMQNERLFEMNICYTPIMYLEKYIAILKEENAEEQGVKIENHIRDIREQRITNIFFLPKGGKLEYDSIVYFDRINSCSREYIDDERIKDMRLFTLSDYGLYLFVLKMSVHFCRITEGGSRAGLNILNGMN